MNNDKPYKLFNGDCLEELKKIKDNSIDAVVTDPPYEISFMNKGWDGSGIAFNTEVWEECLRVLKPGGHLLAFGATRTHHRMMVAIEDAGFEIRDTLMWMYGSGFPKSHNIGKAVDKIEGNEREEIGDNPNSRKAELQKNTVYKSGLKDEAKITKGQSDFEGYGTALKPAYEPIVMARKPVEGTIAENCLKHGTGAINIDDCRIETDDSLSGGAVNGAVVTQDGFDVPWKHDEEKLKEYAERSKEKVKHAENLGRFPANVILDEDAGKQLDGQSGELVSGPTKQKKSYDGGTFGGGYGEHFYEANKGGASRFFYCPKVNKKERNLGLDDSFEEKNPDYMPRMNTDEDGNYLTANGYSIAQPLNKNNHPTVKPKDLLEYLITLVKPPIDCPVILDPFMGSGTTGMAAIDKQCKFVGIEQDEEYMKIAEARVDYIAKKRRFW